MKSGLVQSETWYEDGRRVRETSWGIFGTVLFQTVWTGTDVETSLDPPWRWGATDQTSPSDPQWIAEHGK